MNMSGMHAGELRRKIRKKKKGSGSDFFCPIASALPTRAQSGFSSLGILPRTSTEGDYYEPVC
jgi:hypothetical protein